MTTDMTNLQLIDVATKVVTSGMNLGESYRIPLEGMYEHGVIWGMSVLVPDLKKNAEALQQYLYRVE